LLRWRWDLPHDQKNGRADKQKNEGNQKDPQIENLLVRIPLRKGRRAGRARKAKSLAQQQPNAHYIPATERAILRLPNGNSFVLYSPEKTSATMPPEDRGSKARKLMQARSMLGHRSLVLVGLMGAGKTTVGRLLARCLGLAFADADHEIQHAAGLTVEEIFARFGEATFRASERRMVAALLGTGPLVLATGGGAFMDEETRASIRAHALSVWLKADLDVLVQRTVGRSGRPLLKVGDPKETLAALVAVRYPVYQLADIAVVTNHEPAQVTVCRIIDALSREQLPRSPGAGEPAGEPSGERK
jgi:shikimate kinase